MRKNDGGYCSIRNNVCILDLAYKNISGGKFPQTTSQKYKVLSLSDAFNGDGKFEPAPGGVAAILWK